MEVGDQTIDHFKLITRIDENLGITCPGCQFTVMCLCCTFDCTGGSCAYGNDFIATRFGLANHLDCSFRDIAPFAVHDVILNIIGTHWQESTCTNMQGYESFRSEERRVGKEGT